MSKKKQQGPKVLIFDVETAPILGYFWGLFDQTIGLNQIKSDWHLLSFSAKWLGDPESKIIYHDQRNVKNVEDDSKLLKKIWKLLDECDVVITQNGNKFDIKKLNARFILNGMQPPSSFKKIDTLLIAKKQFGFTSNKLEYMTDKLCTKYKKLVNKKFSGFTLWSECLKGNLDAWNEMELYNRLDVLSLEELYFKLIPWDSSAINFNLYHDGTEHVCKCGNTNLKRNGHTYTPTGRYQRYKCTNCGAETRDNKNMLDKDKKDFLKRGTNR